MAAVIANEQTQAGYGLLRLEAPAIARECTPGQFVMARVASVHDPLLRRAFAVHSADRDAGRLELLYGVVGKGTHLLAALRPGDTLDLLGPLGHGFELDLSRDSLLVAGGFGAAPLLFLAQEISRCGGSGRLFYGCRTATSLIRAAEFERLGIELVVATEDGSRGHRGLVTEVLLPALMAGGIGPPLATVYGCGPRPMLAAVARLCSGVGVPCQVSLHSFMGCGIGACLGCAVPRKAGERNEHLTYAKVCVDGPVFDAAEIELEEL